MCSENFFKKSENFGPQKMNKFIGGSFVASHTNTGRPTPIHTSKRRKGYEEASAAFIGSSVGLDSS